MNVKERSRYPNASIASTACPGDMPLVFWAPMIVESSPGGRFEGDSAATSDRDVDF